MTGRKVQRVTIVLANLSCGGIQRVGVWIAGMLASRGYTVSVITFAGRETDFFTLPETISRSVLARGRPPRMPFWLRPWTLVLRLRQLRTLIRSTEPDVVIARAPQVAVQTLWALIGCSIPVIVTEHGDVSIRQNPPVPGAWRKWCWYKLRRVFYPGAARVVSVSEAVDGNVGWLDSGRRRVIYNPFPPPPDEEPVLPPGLRTDRLWLVSVGRLSHAKGFDLLLEAYAPIARSFPHWQLLILGDGEMGERLRDRARALNLQSSVIFAGAVTNPQAFVQRAQLFVMASRYEGFPNAHGEALSCGIPVVATDCPSGPIGSRRATAGGVRELIHDGVNGRLVPPGDTDALAQALTELMTDEEKRRTLASGTKRLLDRFDPVAIADAWEREIQAVAARPR